MQIINFFLLDNKNLCVRAITGATYARGPWFGYEGNFTYHWDNHFRTTNTYAFSFKLHANFQAKSKSSLGYVFGAFLNQQVTLAGYVIHFLISGVIFTFLSNKRFLPGVYSSIYK